MRRRWVLWLTLAAGIVACGGGVTSPTSVRPPVLPPSGPIVIGGGGREAILVGAGDIALCGSTGAEATARLLDTVPGTVFAAGDNAYPDGTVEDYRRCYEPTWGRHKARTRPAPGNHDYDTPGAVPYFNYFGTNAGPAGLGYYSYSLGDWQIYSLNSNIAMNASSPQVQWLRGELATRPSTCALAYWHHPLFSSGPHGDNVNTQPLWRALYESGADIVIGAHDHMYERFAPQDPDGYPDSVRGIREFVVGTGGAEIVHPVGVHPNSDARWSVNGVLQLVLRADSYTWTFLTDSGAPADVGAGICH